MKNKIIKILLSIVVGVYLMRFGYKFKNDYLSLITQALGYVVISYPFILFFKAFFSHIRYSLIRFREQKEFTSIKGTLYGRVTIGLKGVSGVNCFVKNIDGSHTKYSNQLYVVTNKSGEYKIEHIPSGKYVIEFSKVFHSGSVMREQRKFEINSDEIVKVDFKIAN